MDEGLYTSSKAASGYKGVYENGTFANGSVRYSVGGGSGYSGALACTLQSNESYGLGVHCSPALMRVGVTGRSRTRVGLGWG